MKLLIIPFLLSTALNGSAAAPADERSSRVPVSPTAASENRVPATLPLVSRCLSIEPICRPGTHPICICDSDISLNCSWICGSR